MPRKRKGLLAPRQQRFAKEYVRTGSREIAGRRAGYDAPAESARKNLQNPQVLAAIRAEQIAVLNGELLPLAMRVGREILEDPDAPVTAKTKVFSVIVENTIGRKAMALNEKEPHEMTMAELMAAREELQQMLLDNTRPTLELEATADDLFA